MTRPKTKLTEEEVQLISRALADPSRYQIVKQLGKCETTVPCTKMRACSTISAATISHHMKELSAAGLVEVHRDGRFRHYRLRRDVLDAFLERLKSDLS